MKSSLLIIILILIVITYSIFERKNAYNLFIEGAKEGTKFTVDLFPYMLTFVLATTMLSSCGITNNINFQISVKNIVFPFDIILQALIRPISSSSSLTIMLEIYNKYGADSPAGIIASFIQNSTDTTLYVITFYFGCVKINKTKYAIKAGFLIDIINFLIAIFVAFLYFKLQ